MTVSGDVSDFTSEVQATIISNFASSAGVAEEQVSLTVSSASVRLELTIESTSEAAAQAAQTSLGPALADASAASSLMPAGFTVESTPTIAVTAAPEPGTTLAPPPPSLVTPSESAASSPMGLAIGAGGAAAAVLGLLCIGYMYRKRLSKSRRAKTGQLINAEEVNVEEAVSASVVFQPPLPLPAATQHLPQAEAVASPGGSEADNKGQQTRAREHVASLFAKEMAEAGNLSTEGVSAPSGANSPTPSSKASQRSSWFEFGMSHREEPAEALSSRGAGTSASPRDSARDKFKARGAIKDAPTPAEDTGVDEGLSKLASLDWSNRDAKTRL